jgi:hypothetical protein
MAKNAKLRVEMTKTVCQMRDVLEGLVELFAVQTVNVVQNLFAKTECVRLDAVQITLALTINLVLTNNVLTPVLCLVNVDLALNVTFTITEFNVAALKEWPEIPSLVAHLLLKPVTATVNVMNQKDIV